MIYNQQLAGVTITYDLPFATFKSIGSYQEVNHHGSVNEDGMDLDITAAVPSRTMSNGSSTTPRTSPRSWT